MRLNQSIGAEVGMPLLLPQEDKTNRQVTADLTTQGLKQWEIPCTPDQLEQLMRFRDILLEWNAERMNLTRLVSPKEIAVEHFLDSASLLTVLKIAPGATLLDVGTGAGLPSLPLAILRPDIKVALLEATAKKLAFCEAAARAAGLDMHRLWFVHGRAEDSHVQRELGPSFDVVTARAVAPLVKLAPWCAAYMKRSGGVFAALKGAVAEDEIREARPILVSLNLSAQIKPVSVPGSDRAHTIVVCRQL